MRRRARPSRPSGASCSPSRPARRFASSGRRARASRPSPSLPPAPCSRRTARSASTDRISRTGIRTSADGFVGYSAAGCRAAALFDRPQHRAPRRHGDAEEIMSAADLAGVTELVKKAARRLRHTGRSRRLAAVRRTAPADRARARRVPPSSRRRAGRAERPSRHRRRSRAQPHDRATEEAGGTTVIVVSQRSGVLQ